MLPSIINWRFFKIAYMEWFNHFITFKHIKAFAVNIEQINKPSQKAGNEMSPEN